MNRPLVPATPSDQSAAADKLLAIKRRLQTIWDETSPEGPHPTMELDDLIDSIEGELHRLRRILLNKTL